MFYAIAFPGARDQACKAAPAIDGTIGLTMGSVRGRRSPVALEPLLPCPSDPRKW